ncbi:MAG TPA: hypothetical protein VFP87_05335 [Chitinophagaceae bacterium]|nr:hypothetical protein [Chitinophagaceae bacterium]
MRYFTNYKGYDVQFISGIFHRAFVAGVGWAGNISGFEYKRQTQFFIGDKDSNDV